jgi:hypothetical protein
MSFEREREREKALASRVPTRSRPSSPKQEWRDRERGREREREGALVGSRRYILAPVYGLSGHLSVPPPPSPRLPRNFRFGWRARAMQGHRHSRFPPTGSLAPVARQLPRLGGREPSIRSAIIFKDDCTPELLGAALAA